LFGREMEWGQLARFVSNSASGSGPANDGRLALVYGRRRQGKSLILASLCTETGGFYWEALDGEERQNLASISHAWTVWSRSTTPVRFANWEEALDAVLGASDVAGKNVPVVLDEIPRVITRLAEFPSLLQRSLGPGRSTQHVLGTPLILCGSAFGEMRKLIDGTAPLRGRAILELVVQPFDFRSAAEFWGLTGNQQVAFAHNAFVGGTPAYRTLADRDAPTDGDLDGWVIRRLLEPSSSLFRDGRIVVAEDQQLGDQQRYWGLLAAIVDGNRRWGELELALGQQRGSLGHALDVAIDAGWVTKLDDPLKSNRSIYSLSEPMIRFYRLITEPNMQRLSVGGASAVWRDVRPIVASQILGAHMEQLAIDWVLRFASPQTLGGALARVGPTQLGLRRAPSAKPRPRVTSDTGDAGDAGFQIGGHNTQIDLAGVEAGPRGDKHPIFVAEVKATDARVGIDQLTRLDHAVLRLRAPNCHRLLFSRSGFTTGLERVAASRPEVQLIDLHRLYHGT
jgi:uncharacterized protein